MIIDLDVLEAGLYESGWCQRHHQRRHTWRHTSEGGFNPNRYGVTALEHRAATAFVVAHHYSGRFSQARLRYGLIDRWHDRLVGVAVLGGSMRDEVFTNPLPTLDRTTAADLSRLVLLDEVPAPAESWFATRVFGHAHRDHGLLGAVAMSDPLYGHVGTIYQAMNAAYAGRATAGPVLVLPDGTMLTRRSVQKIRKWEQGAGGVVRRLVAAGAPEPEPGEDGKAYLRRALAAADHRRVMHPGNHKFVFRFGSSRQRRRIPLGFEPQPYPKQTDPIPAYR